MCTHIASTIDELANLVTLSLTNCTDAHYSSIPLDTNSRDILFPEISLSGGLQGAEISDLFIIEPDSNHLLCMLFPHTPPS